MVMTLNWLWRWPFNFYEFFLWIMHFSRINIYLVDCGTFLHILLTLTDLTRKRIFCWQFKNLKYMVVRRSFTQILQSLDFLVI